MNAAITNEVQQGVLTFNDCLTLSFFAAILSALSPHVIVVACTPRLGEKSPLPLAVFLCLLKMDAGLIRVKIIMVDCLRESLIGFFRTFAESANLIQSTAHCFAPTGGGTFPNKGVTAMSNHQSAPNAQSPIVLNPRTLAKAMELLERAQNHAGNLSLQYDNHSIAPDLTMLECEIAQAYDMLSRVIMSGVKKSPPPAKTSPEAQSPNGRQRQTTNHRIERDGAGYDCRVLLNEDGDDYHEINSCCTPPAGYRQVCIKCGFDNFDTGTFYLDCPKCCLQVPHYCRYVALNGGV